MNTSATTTLADTSSSTVTPQPTRAKRLIIGLVGSAVLVAGGAAAAAVAHSHGPSKAPGLSPAVQQAGLVRADRLQDDVDARTAISTAPLQRAATTKADRLQAEVDALTGVAATAATTAQPRTVLNHELQNG